MSGDDPKEVEQSQYAKDLSRISIAQWNDQQRRFAPLENRLIGEVETTAGEMNQAQGWANSAAEQQFAGAREQQTGKLFSAGYNPASPGFAARRGRLSNTESLATGMNETDMGQAMADREVAGQQGVVALGRGQTSDAFSQYGQAANSAQIQAANDAQTALDQSIARNQSYGGLAGVATGIGLNSLPKSQPSQPSTGGSGLQTQAFKIEGGAPNWDTGGLEK